MKEEKYENFGGVLQIIDFLRGFGRFIECRAINRWVSISIL